MPLHPIHTPYKQDRLDIEKLRRKYYYDPNTGLFVSFRLRKVVGFPCKSGHIGLRIGGYLYMVHRLAWFYVYGKWPAQTLDHINRIRWDNRIANLREATESQQLGNMERPNRTSGIRGVRRVGSKWVARYKHETIGSFDSVEEAHQAYEEVANQRFGEFYYEHSESLVGQLPPLPEEYKCPFRCGLTFDIPTPKKSQRRALDARTLKELIHYDPETGVFTRIRGGRRGQSISYIHPSGYMTTYIRGYYYRLHLLAWLYMTGEHPPAGQTIDHINRIKTDNRWCNLRLATASQQAINRTHRSQSSGYRGIRIYETQTRGTRWMVNLTHRGRLYAKAFGSLEEAIADRDRQAQEWYGDRWVA